MLSFWEKVKTGYFWFVDPFIDFLVRLGVRPNTLTTIGTLCACTSGVLFGAGLIRSAGIVLGVTAVFDAADGEVARRTNQSSVFGAFYDSTLDRIADGFLFGGVTFFFAIDSWHRSPAMVVVGMLGMMGAFVTSYTRARAEALGIPMKGIGMLERGERVALLAAPQALFGLALDGLVLRFVFSLLSAMAIVTAVQRIFHVRWATRPAERSAAPAADEPTVHAPIP
jgi:CDP-diacylglycerol--glycerol-3-phosphate 3-phosphatidyltransferase